jgi:hypothetical protein
MSPSNLPRSVRLLALLCIGVASWTARADTLGPSVTVLVNRAGDWAALEGPGSVFACPPGPRSFPIRFIVSATDGDGLGAPFYGTRLIYAWDFGSGQPSHPFDVFSNAPTVVDFTQDTTVRLSVFDKLGNATSVHIDVLVITCF